jgi:hypothetical protein
MSNLYRKFKALLPDAPLLVGTVVATTPPRVELPDGTQIPARGEATLGTRVFVRDGVIEGTAPTLPVELIEI